MGRHDYILVNCEKPRDAAMCNAGAGFVVLSHHSLLLPSLGGIMIGRIYSSFIIIRPMLVR